jgi:hypothetical protein
MKKIPMPYWIIAELRKAAFCLLANAITWKTEVFFFLWQEQQMHKYTHTGETFVRNKEKLRQRIEIVFGPSSLCTCEAEGIGP